MAKAGANRIWISSRDGSAATNGPQASSWRVTRRRWRVLPCSFGASDEVDDLVQDTFVRAFNSLDGFRGDSSFRTWLFTIERRLLLDRRRAEKRRPSRVEVQEGDAATEYDALDTHGRGRSGQSRARRDEASCRQRSARCSRCELHKGCRTRKLPNWSARRRAQLACTITTRCAP